LKFGTPPGAIALAVGEGVGRTVAVGVGVEGTVSVLPPIVSPAAAAAEIAEASDACHAADICDAPDMPLIAALCAVKASLVKVGIAYDEYEEFLPPGCKGVAIEVILHVPDDPSTVMATCTLPPRGFEKVEPVKTTGVALALCKCSNSTMEMALRAEAPTIFFNFISALYSIFPGLKSRTKCLDFRTSHMIHIKLCSAINNRRRVN